MSLELLLSMMGTSNLDTLTSRGICLGDSTIAVGNGKTIGVGEVLFTSYEQSRGSSCVNIAVPGDTINGQLAVWNSRNDKLTFDWVIVQIGLNDMPTHEIDVTLNRYQTLVDNIKSEIRSDAKLIISCMLPCKQRWIDLNMYPYAFNNWTTLNNAIMSTITNVDGRINQHVGILDDGNGNLKSIYDTGDHIHENNSGALVIRNSWRDKLIELGLL